MKTVNKKGKKNKENKCENLKFKQTYVKQGILKILKEKLNNYNNKNVYDE